MNKSSVKLDIGKNEIISFCGDFSKRNVTLNLLQLHLGFDFFVIRLEANCSKFTSTLIFNYFQNLRLMRN